MGAIVVGAAQAADGQINFKGALIAAPCSLDSTSSAQDVEFGNVSTSHFGAVGTTSNTQPIVIKLTGCDTSTYKKAAVRFDGPTPAGSPEVLSTGNDGVAIEILDSKDVRVKVGTNSPFEDLTPETGDDQNDGSGTLNFRARYLALKASDAMTAGEANATASFTVSYE